ncbi:Uncharacterised protein [Mycobacteroides abscessus]|nr:Uncharacterised protein [Mycobacteroides abscessus]
MTAGRGVSNSDSLVGTCVQHVPWLLLLVRVLNVPKY